MTAQRMTVSQFRALQAKTAPARKGTTREPKATKGNKFGAQKEQIDGITFDSKREAARYVELKNRERAKLIRDLELQVRIPLMGPQGPLVSDTGRALSYRADFRYVDAHTGETVIEDAKGFPTKDYKLKKSILRSMGIEVVEV